MCQPALAIVVLGVVLGGCAVEDGGIAVEAGGIASALEASANDDAPADRPSPDAGGPDREGHAGRPNGGSCAAAEDCGSGHCVAGLCCATECVGAGTPCGGTCDGRVAGTCRYPAGETECGPPGCVAGLATGRSVCSGTGVCLPGVSLSCAPYTCDGVQCAAGCTAERPCAAGNFCQGGRCLPLVANGGGCTDAAQCTSGSCVDGRCCGEKACGVCQACTGPGGTCVKVTSAPDPGTCSDGQTCSADGACKKLGGQACAGAGECLSGFCASGVCCESACNGACQSCAMPGAAGMCRTVSFAADPANCGACGSRCSSNHVAPACSAGKCSGACQNGFLDCNGDKLADGCEVDPGTDPQNCGGCGHRCPGTRCLAGTCEAITFTWSFIGAPPSGRTCVKVDEPRDPHAWFDNFLCTAGDFGLRWSSAGPLAGMVCTPWLEPADPQGWDDNFLCAPVDYGLRFSSAGTIPGMRCTLVDEPADRDTWSDNYICAP
jgi:hypothetical protein